jgi:hypothetical protein
MSNGGPVTEAGKAVSSRNATRHGILAMVPVVPGMEQEADWEALRAGIFDSLSPQGPLEEELANRVALQFWRLRRVERGETGMMANAQASVVEDVAGNPASRESYESSLSRTLKDAGALLEESRLLLCRLNELRNLAVEALLAGREPAGTVAEPEVVSSNSARIRVLPDGRKIVTWPDWCTEDLREYLAALESVESRAPDQLREKPLLFTQEEFDGLQKWLAEALAEVEQIQSRMRARVERERRERLLPSEKEMERLSRYEAHLSRELYKALHELEALQARRRGQPAPLARLDITALPPG